ncbi:hypothetical protein ACFQ5M_10150 [Agrilactobacillus yilanensis]|uniref:Monooxygenase n=1 Tax=Agrilactobacillus yilanensis TaxID=2485997 RepID=A0ABW4J7Z0_9LACO|nr:hypothetical protein [Agrilactobacillus yilanensis]
MRNVYLTTGSFSVLNHIVQQHPERQLYLLSPWETKEPDCQLLEMTNEASVFTAPISYRVRYTSLDVTPLKLNNFIFFTFNDDEDHHLWQQLLQFTQATEAPNHHSVLAIKDSLRWQYLLYTSWMNPHDWEAWQASPAFQTINQLKARSVADWRYSESCFALTQV